MHYLLKRFLLAASAAGLALLAGWYYFSTAGIPGLFSEEKLFRFGVMHMTETQKQEYYQHLAEMLPSGIYEAVPDPDVGRYLQPGITKISKKAEITANNAGMRDALPYGPKPQDGFRIICLGDSMVMGTAGKEEDRWSNQLNDLLRENRITGDDKPIEVYSVGVGGWSLWNSTSYLVRRLTEYDPDLVLVMITINDMSDGPGVMGIGQASFQFSPEQRHLGSGTASDHWPYLFGQANGNLLYAGLGPQSRARWTRAFERLRQLEQLLAQNQAHLVLLPVDGDAVFKKLVQHHTAEAGLNASIVFTSPMGHHLPHDLHPDREGHRILADQVLAHLVGQNLVEASTAFTTTSPRTTPPEATLDSLQKALAASALPAGYDFTTGSDINLSGILGGLYPADPALAEGPAPWASTRTILLLKPEEAEQVEITVEVPPRRELFPFELSVALNEGTPQKLILGETSSAGRHGITIPVTEQAYTFPALELVFQTSNHFSTIDDPTMRSFRILKILQAGP